MNRKQRACFCVGFLLLVGATLFPPWRYSGGRGVFRYSGSSYGFLFHPPAGDATVNLTRLFVEWFLILLVSSGFWVVLTKSPKLQSPSKDGHDYLDRKAGGRARNFLIALGVFSRNLFR
jgi:hypothetical protein